MFGHGGFSAGRRSVSGTAAALAATLVMTTGTAAAAPSQALGSLSVAEAGGAAVQLLHGKAPNRVICNTVEELRCADKPKRSDRKHGRR